MKNDGFELIRSIYYDYYSSVCASICDSEHRSASVLHPTTKNYPIASVPVCVGMCVQMSVLVGTPES